MEDGYRSTAWGEVTMEDASMSDVLGLALARGRNGGDGFPYSHLFLIGYTTGALRALKP